MSEKRRYSLFNAIFGTAAPRVLRSSERPDCGLEREVSEEIARADGIEPRFGGLRVPWSALLGIRRDLDIANTTGSALVATVLYPEFVEAWRPVSICAKLGARVLPALPGDVALPRVATGQTVGWIAAEGAAATDGEPTLADATATPHTVAGRCTVSRKTWRQAPLAELVLRQDLAAACGAAFDVAALAGTGAGQPVGIINTGGVSAFSVSSAGSETLAEMLAPVATIAAAGGDPSRLAWAIDPLAFAALAALKRDASSVERHMLEQGDLATLPWACSGNCPSKTGIIGDWQTLALVVWGGGGPEILIDPYTQATGAKIRVACFLDVDVIVRVPGAFKYSSNLAA